jgi:starch-binding outer membrane protein, SusD/RagB family
MKTSIKFLLVLSTFLFSVSCSKDFLDNPPEDKLVADNFFTTDEQVLSSGSALYGRPWFYFNEKFLISIGDLYSGNAIGQYSDLVQFENMSITQGNQFAKEGWDSLFNVISATNALLYNLDKNTKPSVNPEIISRVKAEAYFVRATAYFYLVRTWGAVPILNNFEQYKKNEPLYRNRVQDVYTFIIQDLTKAAAMLPSQTGTSKLETGRLIKVAANGMLAKVYLTLKDYDNAKIQSEIVINSGRFSLVSNYGNLFNDPTFNNSSESIFALHWVSCSGIWGVQNTNQAYLAAAGKITAAGDGWGTFQPSIDLQNAYEVGDKRRKLTVMKPGDFYPELVTIEGGYTVPTNGLTNSLGGFRKYVIGSAAEKNVCFMSTEQNTNILRYADILLIHAESILAGAASTTSTPALNSFNAVRTRAGLPIKTVITQQDIFKERRIEFAVEGDYWYDLARRNRADAIAAISAQERGTYSSNTSLTVSSKNVIPTDSDFLLPLPNTDTDINPTLLLDPVPFKF